MKVRVMGGAEVDLLTGEEADGKLKDLADVFKREIRRRDSLLPLADAGVMPATGVLVLDLGSPKIREWELRRVVTSAADPTASPAGSALLLVSAGAILTGTAGANLPALSVIDATNVLPATFTYSKFQAPIQQSEHLYVVFSGVTAATNLVATALVAEVENGEGL